MKKYNLYWGLAGGFSGADFEEQKEFESQEEAEEYAKEQAEEVYDSYAGLYGLDDVDTIQEENPELTQEEAWQQYEESRENWLDYEAKLIVEYQVTVECIALCGYQDTVSVFIEEVDLESIYENFFEELPEVISCGENLAEEEQMELQKQMEDSDDYNEDEDECEDSFWHVQSVIKVE